MSRVALVTLGCAKNAVDSETLSGLLRAGGHEVLDDIAACDVAVVNTCGFIDPARRETVHEVLELAELKAAGALKGLVLTGCLVARSAGDLADALPEVDAFVDFDAYPRISSIVSGVCGGSQDARIHGSPGRRFDPAWWDAALVSAPRLRLGRAPWAYLKIAEGCDRGCTFCAIPLMRGRLRSRSVGAIEREARSLVGQGVTELSLVSQDSVMWGRDSGEGNLIDVLHRLEGIEELRRIRLMYLHPHGVTEELITAMLDSEVVIPYFDLSLQHVSPAILRGMARWGSGERFFEMIDGIRRREPTAGIRSTFIVGFPGEEDEHIDELEAFIETSSLDWIGVFAYSREEGTRAYNLAGPLPEAVVRERVERIAAAADAAMERRAEAVTGSVLEVLAERCPDATTGVWSGRSHREAPEVDGEIRFEGDEALRVGDYVDVVVTGSEGCDLIGRRRT